MSCHQQRPITIFSFKEGFHFGEKEVVILTIKHAAQESEVDHVAAIWLEDL